MLIRAVPVIVPAYQAGPSVAAVVRRSLRLVDRVFVVDDGSTDATSQEAREAGAEVLVHASNLGKGRALRTAFEHVFAEGFEMAVTLDADGQHLPEEIPKLLERTRAGAALVIGSRDHLFAEMHSVRRTSNRCSSKIISAVAGQPMADIQSGFRVYTRRLIERVGFPEFRFDAESAVVVRAVRLGLRVETVPIRLGFADGRTTSHYRPLVDSLRIARSVARARLDTIGLLPPSRPLREDER